MKTSTYNPSPLEVDFANALYILQKELEKHLQDNQITKVETFLKRDNPMVRFNLVDSLNISIEKRQIVKEGKRAGEENWVNVGYYADLPQAARALLNQHIKLLTGEKEIKNLKAFAQLLAACSAGIEEACAGAKRALIYEQIKRGLQEKGYKGDVEEAVRRTLGEDQPST